MNSKKVFCKTTDSFITRIDQKVFFSLEKYLIETGEGADKDSFAVIKEKLQNAPILNSKNFAYEVIYVILASGFNQQTAKRKYFEIIKLIEQSNNLLLTDLLNIFNNQNKMKAVLKVWRNKDIYCNSFYKLKTDNEKLKFLETLLVI